MSFLHIKYVLHLSDNPAFQGGKTLACFFAPPDTVLRAAKRHCGPFLSQLYQMLAVYPCSDLKSGDISNMDSIGSGIQEF